MGHFFQGKEFFTGMVVDAIWFKAGFEIKRTTINSAIRDFALKHKYLNIHEMTEEVRMKLSSPGQSKRYYTFSLLGNKAYQDICSVI